MLFTCIFALISVFLICIVLRLYHRAKQPVCWSMSLSDPWFDHVKNGTKKFEGRRFYKNLLHFQPNDFIIFRPSNGNNEICIKKIFQIHKFATFEVALAHYNRLGRMNEILPGIDTIEQGVKIYFKYVSLATQIKDGVCLIELDDFDF